jgi:hypothetical protein
VKRLRRKLAYWLLPKLDRLVVIGVLINPEDSTRPEKVGRMFEIARDMEGR